MADFSNTEMDRLLTDARKTLESMRQGGPPAASSDTAPVEGTGESTEGKVKATVVSGGRLKSVEINPRAMRLAAAELGEHIVAAVNAALDDLRAKAEGAGAAEAIDTAALGKRVEQIQNESLRQMEMITQAIGETIAKAGGGR